MGYLTGKKREFALQYQILDVFQRRQVLLKLKSCPKSETLFCADEIFLFKIFINSELQAVVATAEFIAFVNEY